jgi:hypothetical protein
MPRRLTRAGRETGCTPIFIARRGTPATPLYWYRRARKPVCKTSLDEEWAAIAEALLKDEG